MTHQLSLLDAPTTVVDSRPIPTAPSPAPQLTVGALVVPKIREECTTPAEETQFIPLFVDQVCEVVRLGQSLGRERIWAVPVKWMGRIPAAPYGMEDLMLLAGSENDAT